MLKYIFFIFHNTLLIPFIFYYYSHILQYKLCYIIIMWQKTIPSYKQLVYKYSLYINYFCTLKIRSSCTYACVKSGWRDLPSCSTRSAGSSGPALEALSSAASNVRARPNVKPRKKTNIMQLFTPATKFHKHLRR